MTHSRLPSGAPKWMTHVLRLAAVYNVAWGLSVIVAPLALFRWAGMQEPLYPQIWQCVGMIVGVYGIGYWFAASDPYRHWPVVLVGFVGKILGPIGFLQAAIQGDLPWAWGITIVTNDLIWWAPFAAMLYGAFHHNTNTSPTGTPKAISEAMSKITSHRDASLKEISARGPLLLVFLRHSGCTFCREALADLRDQRKRIEQIGATIAIVHMGEPMDGTLMLEKYGLHGLHRFSDPRCELYRAFGLERGEFHQLFSLKVIRNGIVSMMRGHGLGKLEGDGFRMPGTFTLVRGSIVEAQRCSTACERPDYVNMAARAAHVWRRGMAVQAEFATTRATNKEDSSLRVG